MALTDDEKKELSKLSKDELIRGEKARERSERDHR